MRLVVAVLSAAWIGVHAQVPPSPAERGAYTGLFAAALSGDAVALRAQVAGGAKVDARDASGRTPFHVAAFARKHDAMRALVAAGADPNALENDRYDAVTIAAVADDVETLKVALALGDSAKNVTSRYDGTALIAAAHLGHDAVVRELIRAGAPLDHVNNLGWTALVESIVLGDGGPRHVATLKALVDAGANVNLADRGGTTPYALAFARGFREMVEILAKAGSSMTQGFSTISFFNGTRAATTSSRSFAGTENLSKVAPRWRTDTSQSRSVMPSPACDVFMSRPV
jgi:ankyrin repeat protein